MLLSRVWRYIQIHHLLEAEDCVLVAVSGGPDSLCLLHLLSRLAPRLRLSLVVAHLNHGLRPEAEAEAEVVRRLAARWTLPFEYRSVSVPAFKAGRKLTEEEAARILRYRFLLEAAQKHGAGKIALGHQRDDQAETVLFNILRGTGPDGLAGILPRRPLGPVQLVRPLLEVTRREIERYCAVHGLKPVIDGSNLQAGYTRNRIRLELLPYLEEKYNPRVRDSLAGLAALAAADRAYLGAAADKEFHSLAEVRGGRLLLQRRNLLALPEALQGRVARRALAYCLPGKTIGRRQVRQLLDAARGGPGGTVDLPGGARLLRSGDHLLLGPARVFQETALVSRPLRVPGETVLPGGGVIRARFAEPGELTWPPSPQQAYLDYDSLPGILSVRSRWPGAYFHPQGAPGGKKLKKFFIDCRMPRGERARHPLVVAGENVIWVAGLRIAHPFRVTGKTERVLVLEYQPGPERM